jgi:hypothetical protein
MYLFIYLFIYFYTIHSYLQQPYLSPTNYHGEWEASRGAEGKDCGRSRYTRLTAWSGHEPPRHVAGLGVGLLHLILSLTNINVCWSRLARPRGGMRGSYATYIFRFLQFFLRSKRPLQRVQWKSPRRRTNKNENIRNQGNINGWRDQVDDN